MMTVHPNNDALLVGGYEIKPFRDLTRPYQLAIAHYVAVDGEAWEWPAAMRTEMDAWLAANPNATRPQCKANVAAMLDRHLDWFITQHGDKPFGVALVPMDLAKAHVLAVSPEIGPYGTWEAYHAWYMGFKDVPAYPVTDRWPSVLSCQDFEAFEDGWHRFHSYAAAGHPDVPVVFFPNERHMAVAQSCEVA